MLRERLLDRIRADFPSLAIHSSTLVTSRWDHDVVVVNEDYVFRFPDGDDIDLDRGLCR